MPQTRTRPDRCPGVLRPWQAEDGSLVRVRLVGGRIEPWSLAALGAIAVEHGDGELHLTGRANLQLRGLPAAVPVEAFAAAGVLPSRTHELIRNLMVSPASGLSGGRADLRPVADELDRRLLADPVLADLPGRFLFVLDDGRGDLVERPLDLGLVAVDATRAQLRAGSHGWGPVVDLGDAARRLADLARAFIDARGTGSDAPWHVDELTGSLIGSHRRDPRTRVTSTPPPYGVIGGGTYVEAPDGVLSPVLVARLVESMVGHPGPLVVTPWRGVLVP